MTNKDFFGIEYVIKTLNMSEDDARKMREAQQRLEKKRQDLKQSRGPDAGIGGMLSGADQEPTKGGKQQHDRPLITRAQHRLIEEALIVQGEGAKAAGMLGYYARTMIQATMPHKNPGDIPVWGRRNGDFSLTIRPGYIFTGPDQYQSIGIPYGPKPRLLLAWICTEIVRTKERDIVLGNNLSDFLHKLGMASTGGQRGTIKPVKEQARRLFSSTIQYTRDSEDSYTSGQFAVVDAVDVYWDPQDPNQSQLWESRIRVSETLYDEVLSYPVPVDLRVLKALSQSPLAMDIYCWLVHRLGYLNQRSDISWEQIQAQFGMSYGRRVDARNAFKSELSKVVQFYPEAKVDVTEKSLILRPSKKHISR